jgi:hypothetical protein
VRIDDDEMTADADDGDAGHFPAAYIPERRPLPLRAGRTSEGALRPELPPLTLAMGLPYALGLALLTDVISDLLEVLPSSTARRVEATLHRSDSTRSFP